MTQPNQTSKEYRMGYAIQSQPRRVAACQFPHWMLRAKTEVTNGSKAMPMV